MDPIGPVVTVPFPVSSVRKAGQSSGIRRLASPPIARTRQFLVEAATLTGIGGIVGIIFGALLGFLITSLLEWRYFLSPMWTVLGLAISIGTGMIAGMYPAWRAARVDPIVALRYE